MRSVGRFGFGINLTLEWNKAKSNCRSEWCWWIFIEYFGQQHDHSLAIAYSNCFNKIYLLTIYNSLIPKIRFFFRLSSVFSDVCFQVRCCLRFCIVWWNNYRFANTHANEQNQSLLLKPFLNNISISLKWYFYSNTRLSRLICQIPLLSISHFLQWNAQSRIISFLIPLNAEERLMVGRKTYETCFGDFTLICN